MFLIELYDKRYTIESKVCNVYAKSSLMQTREGERERERERESVCVCVSVSE